VGRVRINELGAWVERMPLRCLTFARDRAWQDLLADLGLDPAGASVRTEDEAIPALNGQAVRAVETGGGWAVAVETMSVLGTSTDVLSRLSAGGGEAVNLCWTPTNESFQYYAAGRCVTGFDLLVLSCRWGTEPDRFDQQLHAAGFFADPPDAVASALQFVHGTFGITLATDVLTGPLPTVGLPG
jgi:hypothetical protein